VVLLSEGEAEKLGVREALRVAAGDIEELVEVETERLRRGLAVAHIERGGDFEDKALREGEMVIDEVGEPWAGEGL